MNKKYLIVAIFALALIVILFAFLVRNKDDGDGGASDMQNLAQNVSDPEILAIAEEIRKANDTFKEERPSSIDKIDDAFFSEKIDAEEYALLSIKAIFGDPQSLPEEYRGEKDTSMDNAFLFGLIHSQWNSFSTEAKAKLLPFVSSPRNPNSYYYPKNTDADAKNILDKLSLVEHAEAADDDMMTFGSIEVTPTITVLYAGESEKQAAEWIAQGVRDAQVLFKPFFGMENKKTEITLVTRLNGFIGLAGLSDEPEAAPGQCDIKILIPQDEKGLKTTTAHELFHCYQFWMDLVYLHADTKWLMEATATWSEDYVYHSYATEHRFDGHFFGRTDLDLLSIASDHEYALYLWFYFLRQQSQDDPHHIYRALRLGTTNDVRGGMELLEDFSHIHRDFALWNWNREPFLKYVDDPKFPSISPYYTSVKQKEIASVGETSYPIALEKGAMTYNMIFFPNESVRKIEFNPSKFTGSDEKSTRGLQALYKVNGQWLYEDWTGVQKRTFCRELPEENIEMVVLIANNAELRAKADGIVPITTDKRCGSGWRGTVSVSWQKQNKMSLGWAEGSYTEKADYHVSELLEYDPEYDNFLVAEQQYFAKFESKQKVDSPSKECGQMWKHDTKRYSGSGFIEYKKSGQDKDSMPERANGDGDEDMNEIGGTYLVNFGMFGSPKEYGEKFSGIDMTSTLNKDCSFRMIPQADGLKVEQYKMGSNVFTYEPNGNKITIDKNAKSFSGQDRFEISDNVFGTVRWNYVKVE